MAYLGHYYRTEISITQDTEMQNWIEEISSGLAGVKDTYQTGPRKINSLKYLVDVTTHVIFTASTQHAAVNFPQYDMLSFMPLSSFGLKGHPHKVKTKKDYWNLFQDGDVQLEQQTFLLALSEVKHTSLGDYTWIYDNGKEVSGTTLNELVKAVPTLHESLNRFKEELVEIEGEIQGRNKLIAQGKTPLVLGYPYLKPSQIPQSINI